MPLITGFDLRDELNGTSADDEIRGNGGNDTLWGGGGNDSLFGGAGNDIIQLSVAPRTAVADGGDGDDYIGLNPGEGSILVTAGAGNDVLEIAGRVTGQFDAGAGNDEIRVRSIDGQVTLRLGAGGADEIKYFGGATEGPISVVRVEDFQPGDAGDVFGLALSEYLLRWDLSNPFDTQHVRLVADGADTLVQVDLDGGGDAFATQVRLVGVAPGQLTPHNFRGYSPAGGEPAGSVIVGPAAGDRSNLIGGVGPDTITSHAPNDFIMGGAGNDLLHGGDGADEIAGYFGDDTASGGAGADFIHDDGGHNELSGNDGDDRIGGGLQFDAINGNMGADTVSGSSGDDWVLGGKDDDRVNGDAGNDLVHGNLGQDTCDGGDGADTVLGGQGDDIVTGRAGDDYVSGDRGNDTVTGGAGADVFHGFAEGGFDLVADFNAAGGDRVLLDPGTGYGVSQFGNDTMIFMNGGAQMTLLNVQLSSLPAGWILVG